MPNRKKSQPLIRLWRYARAHHRAVTLASLVATVDAPSGSTMEEILAPFGILLDDNGMIVQKACKDYIGGLGNPFFAWLYDEVDPQVDSLSPGLAMTLAFAIRTYELNRLLGSFVAAT